MSSIFGGSKSKSTQSSSQSSNSYNQAFPAIQSLFAPMGAYAFNSGVAAQDEILGNGFEGYKQASGFDFLKEMGLKNLMGAFAGGGTFQSGAAGKAIQNYGANLAKTFADNYLQQQTARAGLGLNVGNLLSGTGGVSSSQGTSTGTSTSKSSNGAGGFLGALAASEREIKTNIALLGLLEDGLGIYSYEYKDEPGVTYIGTMVDEVEELRPWALGPRTEEGYRTVDYSKLGEK